MTNWGDAGEIRKRAVRQKTPMWTAMQKMVGPMTRIAEAVYPVALDGLTRNVLDMHSPNMYEEENPKYDLTLSARRAFQVGVSGFYINMFSPARRNWRFVAKPSSFSSGTADDESNAKSLDALTEASRYLLYQSKTNREILVALKHLIAFGFACVLIRPETEKESRTRGKYLFSQCLRVGTYALDIDGCGSVNRVLRHFACSAEQLAGRYGVGELPPQVLTALENGSRQMFEVWQLIEPHERGYREDKRGFVLSYDEFAYRSITWLSSTEGENEGILEVAGYKRKPFVAPRLEFEIGDVYGRGRYVDQIGLIEALQTICEDCLDISGQHAQPAVNASEELRSTGVHIGRRGINWVSGGEQAKDAVTRTLQTPSSTQESREEGARIQQEIREASYNNEFASINMDDQNNPVRTATEIEYRKRQSLEQLSGAATTMEDELEEPLAVIMRDYALDLGLARLEKGFDVSGLDIRYESAVHMAMNAPDVNSRTAGFAFAAQIAQMQAASGRADTVLDNFDLDALVRAHYRTLGAPEKDLKSVAKVRQERKGAAEARAAQAAVAERAQGAAIARDEAAARKDAAAARKDAAAARATAGGDFAAVMAGI